MLPGSLSFEAADTVDIDSEGPIPDADPVGVSFSFTVSGVGTVQAVVLRLAIENVADEDLTYARLADHAMLEVLQNQSDGDRRQPSKSETEQKRDVRGGPSWTRTREGEEGQ